MALLMQRALPKYQVVSNSQLCVADAGFVGQGTALAVSLENAVKNRGSFHH